MATFTLGEHHDAVFLSDAGSTNVDVQRFSDESIVIGDRAEITRINNGDSGDGIIVAVVPTSTEGTRAPRKVISFLSSQLAVAT